MCGLVGVLSFAERARDELVGPVQTAMQQMARRGPDDEGAWTDGTRCALGFRRLSIIDLNETGHQPMLTRDGRYALVFNGEIYNYRELRKDLEARGHTLRSTGDAEVLLLSLVEWGVQALDRLNGMFALALYDTGEKRLLLARDHAGIKPLHYAVTSRGVVFGSQYDQILAHPWMHGAAPSKESIGLYLRFGFVPAPYGLHDGARQVQAGDWIEIQSTGAMRRQRYFSLPAWREPTLRDANAVEAFDEAFSRAVRRHLIADVPVGVLLSGGIDSPLVAAEARRAHAGSLEAFTIEVAHQRHNELDDARKYASELELEHHIEQASAADALGLLDDVIAASTEPTADHSMFPMLMLSRLARSKVKVVLSGDGGDELFWGYAARFGNAIELAPYFRWPRGVRALGLGVRRVLGHGFGGRDALQSPDLGSYYQRKHTLLGNDDLTRIFPELPPLPQDYRTFDCASSTLDRAAQWLRWNEFELHLARVLAKVDRASMFHSLEVRVPLLDREVIDVASRTDWRTCLNVETGVGKQVLRRALSRRVRHATAAKRGFAIPMYEWLVGPLAELLRENVLNARDLLGVPVNREALADVDRRLRNGERGRAWGLWSLLSLALWSRAHAGVRP